MEPLPSPYLGFGSILGVVEAHLVTPPESSQCTDMDLLSSPNRAKTRKGFSHCGHTLWRHLTVAAEVKAALGSGRKSSVRVFARLCIFMLRRGRLFVCHRPGWGISKHRFEYKPVITGYSHARVSSGCCLSIPPTPAHCTSAAAPH